MENFDRTERNKTNIPIKNCVFKKKLFYIVALKIFICTSVWHTRLRANGSTDLKCKGTKLKAIKNLRMSELHKYEKFTQIFIFFKYFKN